MAASPVDLSKLMELHAGQTGMKFYHGYAAFVAAGVTVEVYVPFRRVTSFVAFPIGTPNANEPLSVNETITGESIVGATTGTALTVTRAAGTTADLAFFFFAFGY